MTCVPDSKPTSRNMGWTRLPTETIQTIKRAWLKEKVHQTTKDLLEEQTTKEKSTGEDCGQHTSPLTHGAQMKALVV